ncbi:hypothetical protein Pelo_9208 [Pelomyxa schiedti]|nr:hypothetical protein Pelo_9208 [Pelomyxa schiedti]
MSVWSWRSSDASEIETEQDNALSLCHTILGQFQPLFRRSLRETLFRHLKEERVAREKAAAEKRKYVRSRSTQVTACVGKPASATSSSLAKLRSGEEALVDDDGCSSCGTSTSVTSQSSRVMDRDLKFAVVQQKPPGDQELPFYIIFCSLGENQHVVYRGADQFRALFQELFNQAGIALWSLFADYSTPENAQKFLMQCVHIKSIARAGLLARWLGLSAPKYDPILSATLLNTFQSLMKFDHPMTEQPVDALVQYIVTEVEKTFPPKWAISCTTGKSKRFMAKYELKRQEYRASLSETITPEVKLEWKTTMNYYKQKSHVDARYFESSLSLEQHIKHDIKSFIGHGKFNSLREIRNDLRNNGSRVSDDVVAFLGGVQEFLTSLLQLQTDSWFKFVSKMIDFLAFKASDTKWLSSRHRIEQVVTKAHDSGVSLAMKHFYKHSAILLPQSIAKLISRPLVTPILSSLWDSLVNDINFRNTSTFLQLHSLLDMTSLCNSCIEDLLENSPIQGNNLTSLIGGFLNNVLEKARQKARAPIPRKRPAANASIISQDSSRVSLHIHAKKNAGGATVLEEGSESDSVTVGDSTSTSGYSSASEDDDYDDDDEDDSIETPLHTSQPSTTTTTTTTTTSTGTRTLSRDVKLPAVNNP